MQTPDVFEDFLSAVTGEVRWPKARGPIRAELMGHLEDAADDLVQQGYPQEEAAQRAVSSMGDPFEVGRELDRLYRPKRDLLSLILLSAILLAGVLMRFFAMETSGGQSFSALAAIAAIVMGGTAIFFCQMVDSDIWQRCARPLYWLLTALILLCGLLGGQVNGLPVFLAGPFQMPVSYLLLFYPPLFASILWSLGGGGMQGAFTALFYTVPPLLTAALLPNFSGLILCAVIFYGLYYYAVFHGWFGCAPFPAAVAGAALPAVGLGLLLMRYGTYLFSRLIRLFVPSADPGGSMWIRSQTQKILHNSAWLGKGTGAGVELPSLSSDYLLTWLISRAGWLPFLLLCGALLGLMFHGLRLALRQKDLPRRCFVLAILGTFFLETLFYLLNNLGFCLLGAFPLPLISGNGSVVIHLALWGMLLSVYRGSSLPAVPPAPGKAPRKLFELAGDGKLIIYYR